MKPLDADRGVTRTEPGRAGQAWVWGGQRLVGLALLVSAIVATLAGCVVAPGYVAPAPVVVAPAPVVVYPGPVVYRGWPGHRWSGHRWPGHRW
jgi:hypothetical protein